MVSCAIFKRASLIVVVVYASGSGKPIASHKCCSIYICNHNNHQRYWPLLQRCTYHTIRCDSHQAVARCGLPMCWCSRTDVANGCVQTTVPLKSIMRSSPIFSIWWRWPDSISVLNPVSSGVVNAFGFLLLVLLRLLWRSCTACVLVMQTTSTEHESSSYQRCRDGSTCKYCLWCCQTSTASACNLPYGPTTTCNVVSSFAGNKTWTFDHDSDGFSAMMIKCVCGSPRTCHSIADDMSRETVMNVFSCSEDGVNM